MQAASRNLISIVGDQSIRFEIPFFQRPYSWTELHCKQLLEDVIAIAQSPNADAAHFTGSMVYVAGPNSPTGTTASLLIDGQQRFTTIELLITALAELARDHDGKTAQGEPLGVTYDEILDRGLVFSKYKQGEDRYRISLSHPDKEIFFDIIDHLIEPKKAEPEEDSRLIKNLAYFRQRLAQMSEQEQGLMWRGLNRLEVVYVSLEARDNPQLVFESMNSTGKPLAQSDLVRNYVLLGLPKEEQRRLYDIYWRPIEESLRIRSTQKGDERSFDDFMFYYLQVAERLQGVRYEDIYREFKKVVPQGTPIEPVLQKLQHYAQAYGRIRFPDTEKNEAFKVCFSHFRDMDIGVSSILLLSWYHAYSQGSLTETEFVDLMGVLESYFVRRFVCKMSSNVYNKYFPRLMAEFEAILGKRESVPDFSPSEAFAALLEREKGTNREFPEDEVFVEQLSTMPFFKLKTARVWFVLKELEHFLHPKYENNVVRFSIEHIFPQTIDGTEWEALLGENDRESYETYKHRLGNLTLSSMNSEMSNRPFLEKRDGYYRKEALALNSTLIQKNSWTLADIDERSIELSHDCKKRWAKGEVTSEEITRYGLKVVGEPS